MPHTGSVAPPPIMAMALRLGARLRAQLPVCWGSSSLLRVGPAWVRSSPAPAHAHDARPCRALVASASLLEADSGPVNIYTSFTVYKGKGAVSLKLIKPTWEQTSNGGAIRVERAGTVLLEFAAASGERQYDWENKGVIGLSAVECGEVLEALEARREASFFHDPNKSGRSVAQGARRRRRPAGCGGGLALSAASGGKLVGRCSRPAAARSNLPHPCPLPRVKRRGRRDQDAAHLPRLPVRLLLQPLGLQ